MNTHLSSLSPPAVTSTPMPSPLGPAYSRHKREVDVSPSSKNSHPIEASVSLDRKPIAAPTPENESDFSKGLIYGSVTTSAPTANFTQQERTQRVDAYAGRVVTHIKNIESGSEGERNIKFQKVRQFLEPAGYFSGGLLAAGYDSHEKITVTFTSYVGQGKPETLTNTDKRTYFAWEIAAGALEHDKVQRGGPINFQFMEIERKDRSKVADLESQGKQLQNHWENEVSKPMRDDSGALAKRSGQADAYVVRGTLQSLADNKDSFEKLSPAGQEAVKHTLQTNGQVIIPNVYGFPLSGYAFIPYTPFDGIYEHRPNKGVMLDLKNGAVHEIQGDASFANWAKDNRNNLQRSFNASNRQGGNDAHWPKAGDVLNNLIVAPHATYPGYSSLLADKAVPVSETFNYTESRGIDYRLKFGNLDSDLAGKYQEVNAKNAVWSDQTEVFGSSQQNWKFAKDLWGSTFGYIPDIGNTGNIVFGVHDSIFGMTANDRVGGSAAAVISGLQLVHELAPVGVEAGLGDPPIAAGTARNYSWNYNAETRDVELVRAPKTSSGTDAAPVAQEGVPKVAPAPAPSASFPGMQEVEFNGRKYFVSDKPDDGDGEHYLLRVQHPEDPSKLASSGIIAKPDEAGVWHRRGLEGGGRWFWNRTPSPTPSDDLKIPPKISDGFQILGDPRASGANRFDDVLKYNSDTVYEQSVGNFEEGGLLKRKLTVSWVVEENNFDVYPSERAQLNEHSSTEYSPNFIKDLNRDHYTVQIKQPDRYTTVELDGIGSAEGETLSKRLKQFEDAIPDPNLRSRISEVAHQGSVAPTSVELKINQLQDHVGFRGEGTHYLITYDPATNRAVVQLNAKLTLLDLDKDATKIPDMEVVAQRTFKIGESNNVDADANPYMIEKEAPFSLSVSSISDLK